MRYWIGFSNGTYSGENIRHFLLIFISFILLFIVIPHPSYAISLSDPHENLTDDQRLCENCHTNHIKTPRQEIQQSNSLISNANSQWNNIQSLAATSVVGNITLIASLGQDWYQQGIYGPNASGNISIDKSWGWTFFDERPSSGFITPPDKTTQKNRIYALLLDSGNNSNPVTGAQVTANITYWLYDGTTYTNSTTRIQLIEDMGHSGLYVGNFYFYGGTPYVGYGMSWCDGCHLSYYTSAPDSVTGYFPGNYTVKINATVNDKETTSKLNFEVTPWGCEDCHGSGDQHRDNKVNVVTVDMDSACYLCHGVNQIVHDTTDAGNPHQNTGHRSIPCTDCHTNKSLNQETFNGVTFTQGGLNNAPLPKYDFVTTQLNGDTHESLTCIECHNDLTLPTPQGIYKPDNYTIKNTINNFTPSLPSIQEFQDYYVLNVTQEGPLNITLDWEGTANIGFYLYTPNFNPRNRSDPLNPDKGDYPYYNGSNGEIFVKPKYFANNTPLAGKWILAVYGYDLLNWIGTLKPSINYTINSTYPIQQKDLPTIPECNNCHNPNGAGKAYTNDNIPDWNPGFAHVDINRDGTLDIQCRMCHNAMHNITIKVCQTCHTTAPTGHPISEPSFSQYTQSQCLSCHGDPHEVTMAGGGCVGCHSSPGTRYYVDTSLFAGHANLNASDGANNVTDADCMTCHFGSSDIIMSPDAGLGAANHSNTWFCDDCHTTGGPGPIKPTNSALIKDGTSHGSTNCQWCHIAGDPLPRPLDSTLRFHPNGPRGTASGKNCLTCHYYANLPDLPFHAPGEAHESDINECGPECHDSANNHAVTPLNSNTPPTISGLSATTPVFAGSPVQVQATVNEDMTQIAAAQYQVKKGSIIVKDWTNMTPIDGRFNSLSEVVNTSIDTSTLLGTYTINIKGMASAYRTNPSLPYYPLNGQWSGVYNTQFIVEEPEGYNNGTVYGILGNHIAGATVSTDTGISTTTNETGFYSLSLVNGTYHLTVSKEPEYYANSSVFVTVTAFSTVTQDIILALKPTGTIIGKVTN
ncbi:hypothetical protein METP3_02364 [Methanosarcinales archaeon]|nr:hypothetical protein METP3_02364 [Methanosarcinales archaeon]